MSIQQAQLDMLKELHQEALTNAATFRNTIVEISWNITANFLGIKIIDLEAAIAKSKVSPEYR